MKICPKCGKSFKRLLAVSRVDNETMICDECGTIETLNDLPYGLISLQAQTEIIEAIAEENRRQENNE